MQITKDQYDTFFDDVDFRSVEVPSTGEEVQLPLVGVKATQMVSFHTASRAQVLEILPSSAYVPAELADGQTIVGIIAIEYNQRNIDSYNEVVVVIPVRVGDGAEPPTVDDLLSEELGGATLFVRHIAVTTRTAEIVGNELLGYAKFVADIDFVDLPDERIAVFAENGQEILRIAVGHGEEFGEYERSTLSVVTHKAGLAHKLTYSSQTRYATPAEDRNVLIFGDHPIGRNLAGLGISAKPLLAMTSPYFQLISDDRNLEVFKP
ncbi:acetoacetate decarboxylase family protein [Gordonia sp. NPDC003376]